MKMKMKMSCSKRLSLCFRLYNCYLRSEERTPGFATRPLTSGVPTPYNTAGFEFCLSSHKSSLARKKERYIKLSCTKGLERPTHTHTNTYTHSAASTPPTPVPAAPEPAAHQLQPQHNTNPAPAPADADADGPQAHRRLPTVPGR